MCYGQWEIIIDGILLTGIENLPFDTTGTYSSWHFENWLEVFEDFEDGVDFSEDWLSTNGLSNSLIRHRISLTTDEKIELFSKIQEQDWRHGSCGGCI